MTPPPDALSGWLLFLGALGAGSTGVLLIWRRWIRPAGHALRVFFEDVHTLRELIEADVIARLEDGDKRFDQLDGKVEELRSSVDELRDSFEQHAASSPRDEGTG